ncbi:Terpene synthase metal-binding domain [Arabidopsis thaliana x Arabidopsis arenosa]|uniref:Terpene synthase metal-binding domain n=1 Tax=Arabidopsis thaliana x Arabidopsis arenosa TaxID=1240361 RepID=A0A8T2BGE1_9BRAS|nr:Terpene synthase metal-binding domain [Arabidopsis thaliana x Arabidopsis arenosa]
MKSSYASSSDDLHALVNEIKREIQLSNINLDPYSFVSPSAYDTAWLSMIEEENNVGDDELKPMFQDCLDWIMCNQNAREGFWGNSGSYTTVATAGDEDGEEDMYILTSTLACVVALQKWNTGCFHLHKGTRYIERNTEMIIGKYINEEGSYPRWFVIKFTGILELAQQLGLHFVFSSRCIDMIKGMFYQRQEIIKREKLVDDCNYKPLLAYLEVLPSKLYVKNQEDIIVKSLDSIDGSLFQSPSATASAFMLTRNTKCLAYLQNLVQKCPNGVPQKYPLNEDLIKLSMVNLIESTGLGEFFGIEIEHVLEQVYRHYEEKDVERMPMSYLADQLHKDSLAFRMLRMHGRDVSPRSFCWFLNDQEMRYQLERNVDSFLLVILNVYRATDLMFPGENDLEEAREYTRNLLKKSRSNNEKMIVHELSTPWIARLKHLDHRMWIENKNSNALSVEKASFLRLNSAYSNKLTHLAAKTFEFRQAKYCRELEELTMWVKKWGLSDIGFGREKTTYSYFATVTSLPYEYAIKFGKLAAKSAILITIADDFFDEVGSFNDLEALTKAVLRWEGEELKGYGKIIFRALDDIVRETAYTCRTHHKTDIIVHLRNIWGETFESWLREAEWSKKGHTVTMEEYIRNGMISIAAHTIALSISCLMEPCFPQNKLKPGNYDNITTLLMIISRLLNDLQSYQKEQEQGKINSVLLHLKNHPGLEIEDSIAHIEKIIDSKRKEFMEHVLVDGQSDLPKPCKEIHMSCCKVFEMFFNKKNRYDSNTEMLQDIKKALYDPVNVYELSETEPMPLMTHGDDFMILPLLLNSLAPNILEFKRKDEYGAMKTSMCLGRTYSVHKRVMASQLDDQQKPLKIVASQRKPVPMMPSIFAPCFY